MTDDIVPRLRMSADLMQGFPQMKARHFNAEWVIEAADEIERIRKLSNELLEALTEMADKEMLPKITIRLRDTAQALEQAVRGE